MKKLMSFVVMLAALFIAIPSFGPVLAEENELQITDDDRAFWGDRLNARFADNCVMVKIAPEYRNDEKICKEDFMAMFPDIALIDVEDYTYRDPDTGKYLYEKYGYQRLMLILETQGKVEVLKTVEKLTELDCVYYAYPLFVPSDAPEHFTPAPDEETYFWHGSIDENFASDCVLVTIKQKYGGFNKPFTVNMFPGVELTEISELSAFTKEPHELPLLNLDKFHQCFELKLANKGKEEVIKAINELENLEFILNAMPNHYISVDPIITTPAPEPDPEPIDSPKTGMPALNPLWLILPVASTCLIVFLFKKRKQHWYI